MKKKFFTLLWLAGLVLLAAKYPPGLHWREISRGQFSVIFPGERWPQAETALAAAENAYAKLVDFWRDQPAGRIRIVLDDSTDEANGFATFFPFNLVGINLHEPSPESTLASSRNWLDLVLAHELTHIFTMNAAAEPFLLLRRVFGSQPVLYPAVQLPPWVSEGLAVYSESKFTGDGRLNHPPYPQMLAAARQDNLFPEWRAINGMPAAWPGSTAKYLYGGGFMQFLADKYGADSLRQYLEWSTSFPIIFSSSRDFQKTFGEPLNKLWKEYRGDPSAPDDPLTRQPLYERGFSNQYPCPLNENELVYFHRDYQGQGKIVVLDLKTGREKVLFKMDAVNSLKVAGNNKKMILSAIDNYHAFSEFSDLYEYDLERGKLKRLSHGERFSQPVSKEGSEEIYCVQRRDDGYFLVLFDVGKRTIKMLSPGFAGLSQLSLSPDQSLIGAAVKPEGGPWGIGVFSRTGDLRAFVTAAGADCRQPVWQNDKTFFFIQANAKTTRLASFSLAGSGGTVCSDQRLNGLQQFSLDSDGQTIYFAYYSGRGLEIARLGLAGLLFYPQELEVASTIPEPSPAVQKIISRSYRFWRDLLPQYWSPAWRLGGDEFQAGISTSGQDALAIHSYSLEGYYGFSSRRANVSFNYTYDGLFPTLSLSYIDNSDFYHKDNYSLRSQELKLASLWPLRVRRRSQLYGYADLHLERRTVIFESDTNRYPSSYNGFRLGFNFNSTHEYYDSISPSAGVRFTLQYSLQPAGLVNEFASHSAQADLRHYIPLFRPGVLAWRLALARSWDAGSSYYTMGGGEGVAGSGLGSSRLFELLRSFPAGFQHGDRGVMFNLEYRFPLFKIEKAVLPAVSLDRVWLNVFLDMGSLWDRYSSEAIAYSIGGETVLRLTFGGATYTDLAFGAAFGFGPERFWRIYLRSGRSF